MENMGIFILVAIGVWIMLISYLDNILSELSGNHRSYWFWALLFTPIVACLLAILDRMETQNPLPKKEPAKQNEEPKAE